MKVLIADAHPSTRLGIKSLLLMSDVRIVGETGDAGEALRFVEEKAKTSPWDLERATGGMERSKV